MTQEDDEYWKARVTEARRTQLATVKSAAAAWTALFAAVLGVFGAVTFAGGLTTVDKLPASIQPWTKAAMVGAAILALIATVLSGLASSRLPKVSNNTSFSAFRDSAKSHAEASYRLLRISRWLGSAAAVLVITGSITVIIVGEAPGEKEDTTVLAVVDGKVICGPIARNGGALEVANHQLETVSEIFPVAACP